MLKLNDEEFRRLQLTELELLKEADRICKKHDIHYVIIAGTLLGAVRHGGFIPWDDDADIAMLREDYDRFREICKTELADRPFYFQDDAVTEGYRWGYGKFRRADTIYSREGQESMPYEQGIMIDVFPMDGVPDSGIGRRIKDLQCFFVRKFLWSRIGKTKDKSALKRTVYRLMDRVPEEKLKNYYHKMVRKAGKDTKYVRILLFPTGNKKKGYLRRWYAESEEILFEGYPFEGIRDKEEYLSFKFGNYMEYPPVEERIKKQHPVTVLKFAGDSHIRRESEEKAEK